MQMSRISALLLSLSSRLTKLPPFAERGFYSFGGSANCVRRGAIIHLSMDAVSVWCGVRMICSNVVVSASARAKERTAAAATLKSTPPRYKIHQPPSPLTFLSGSWLRRNREKERNKEECITSARGRHIIDSLKV